VHVAVEDVHDVHHSSPTAERIPVHRSKQRLREHLEQLVGLLYISQTVMGGHLFVRRSEENRSPKGMQYNQGVSDGDVPAHVPSLA
jgi:hypothetical protein